MFVLPHRRRLHWKKKREERGKQCVECRPRNSASTFSSCLGQNAGIGWMASLTELHYVEDPLPTLQVFSAATDDG